LQKKIEVFLPAASRRPAQAGKMKIHCSAIDFSGLLPKTEPGILGPVMKSCFCLAAAAAALLIAAPSVRGAEAHPAFIYESPNEFFGSGDFDGDGRQDLVIVDKESGKFRLGYQLSEGVFSWVDCQATGLKGVTGFTLGKLLDAKLDALAFTEPDDNQIVVVGAPNPKEASRPIKAAFSAALGPSTIVAVETGGAPRKGLPDFYVASIYNSPEANLATLLRNDGAEFPKLADAPLPGPAVRGNRLSLKTGQPELLCVLVKEEKGDTLRIEDLSSGKPVIVATAAGLPAGSDYAIGNFRGSPLRDFVFYKPGANQITARQVEETAPGKFQIGAGSAFDLGQPIRRVVALHRESGSRLFVIFGEGETAGVFDFNGTKAPVLVQTLAGTNDTFTCAESLPGGFIAYLQPAGGKFSARYQIYKFGEANFTAFGGLSSLADNDNITIPDIHSRIVAGVSVKSETEMKPYSNAIPGTQVFYRMVPIPGGEFVMGSPETEAGRKPDEGPQHKVKVAPFWMEQCEVTWNEYELFMYPDEEKRTRATLQTDPAGDKLADAVTHPSKPYVEMSFGMGKDGFPAIAMTHHAANKYCQWLSAKTGHFYRLPTEAEWEYACRAGTTTSRFFGDDASKLGEYAWYEENSDFKYQKVGKKKPNPWGLYDMYGNVTEWVLDGYGADYYQQAAGHEPVVEPWNKATQPYPHAVRGGSWDDAAVLCRSAARRGSDRTWKMQDPQLPKSIWYFSDAQFVGFRIIRPLNVPSAEAMQKYWTSGTEKD
jgi:formylglycine-generating enzyme required for sulfatase activity